jgi:hypothetical protein
MPQCAGPRHTIAVHNEKNAFPVEPNTGVPDENPVLCRGKGNPEEIEHAAEGMNIPSIALMVVLGIAVLYIALNVR